MNSSKHFTFLIILFAFSAQGIIAQEPSTVWNVDKSHSSIGFSVDHMVISTVYGSFNDFSAVVKSDKPDFSDVSVNFTIQTTSIDTKEPKRDEHLRSADFFDAAKYPVISFVGKKFLKVSGNQYKLTGDLTMHGVTKSVTLDAKFGVINDPFGFTRAAVQINADLDRYEYGLKWNKAIEAGGLMVGQNVKLMINVEMTKAK
jgi:polyisoprenoid-binding protein YceI